MYITRHAIASCVNFFTNNNLTNLNPTHLTSTSLGAGCYIICQVSPYRSTWIRCRSYTIYSPLVNNLCNARDGRNRPWCVLPCLIPDSIIHKIMFWVLVICSQNNSLIQFQIEAMMSRGKDKGMEYNSLQTGSRLRELICYIVRDHTVACPATGQKTGDISFRSNSDLQHYPVFDMIV